MPGRKIRIEELMNRSKVPFGTSGARGLASDMTDEVCYAYTVAFLQYLESTGDLEEKGIIGIGGDFRPSTDRIMKAVSRAIESRGYIPENCGKIPSPTLAYYGLVKQIPTVMVTGSHIPADRNGIKYTKAEGEILKHDESAMKQQEIQLPEGLFDDQGMLKSESTLPPTNYEAYEKYARRYVDFFGTNCLEGLHIGVYQHSAVGRDLMVEILSGLGAEVMPLGISDVFIPVDTEAVRPEDRELAKNWAAEYGFDALVSSDGDSDRPLISDETGNWLRGDVAGILCADYLNANAVVTPVSCNTALEKCGLFERIYRTKIGSPYVIEGMFKAQREGGGTIVGYEANGGLLLGSPIQSRGRQLMALPTRDAVIVHIAILLLSKKRSMRISELLSKLPPRYTFSDRLKDFPTEKSKEKLSELYTGDWSEDKKTIESVFGRQLGEVDSLDVTDGLRITFRNGEIVHLRPSGNAPEFRCYTEADTESRATTINKICTDVMSSWR
jgi:phosphomannomutase